MSDFCRAYTGKTKMRIKEEKKNIESKTLSNSERN